MDCLYVYIYNIHTEKIDEQHCSMTMQKYNLLHTHSIHGCIYNIYTCTGQTTNT